MRDGGEHVGTAANVVSPIDAPVAEGDLVRFRRRINLLGAVREVWQVRTVVRRLTMREIQVRYRNAFLGIGWAVVTPVALMLTFTLVLGRVAKVNTGGAPYPLFAYLGLISWFFLASSLLSGSTSLLSNASLIKRAYLPREVFPLAHVAVATLDFVLASVVILALFPLMHQSPNLALAGLPIYLGIQILFTFGLTLFLAAAVVYVRDLRHVLGIGLQVGLFATPVGYGLWEIPDRFRVAYVTINPIATVIDGYRRALLYGQGPELRYVLPSGAAAVVVAVAGYWAFKRMETGVADLT